MFVGLEFGGWSGHSGVLLTGLGAKNCFLHLTGTSYPKQDYAAHGDESPSNTTRNLTSRVLIPSLEDGNAHGVSEQGALDYWRYYKMKTYAHKYHGENWKDPQLGRKEAINRKYSNENHNCSLFANRLLMAACLEQNVDPGTGTLTTVKWLFTATTKTPGWFRDRCITIRDRVLRNLVDASASGGDLPRYGIVLENLQQASIEKRYLPSDNLVDGTSSPPKGDLAQYYNNWPAQITQNARYIGPNAVPPKKTYKWESDKTRRPGHSLTNGQIAHIQATFSGISGL